MRNLTIFLPLSLSVIAGCTSAQRAEVQNPTGAMLRTDYLGGTDVEGFHFAIARVACDGEEVAPFSWSSTVDLADSVFPHGVELVEETFDSSSQHIGSDLFVALEAGCYQVTATPATAIEGEDWTPSADCAASSTQSVEIDDGTTTDVILVSQCQGDVEIGNLNAVASINHPPVVELAVDTAFNYQCEPVTVCAIATDDDNDAIAFAWDADTFSVTEGEASIIGVEDAHFIWEQCAVVVTESIAAHEVSVTAYDLDAAGARLEDTVDQDSHDDQTMSVHTQWGEEPMCWDADAGEVVRVDGYDDIARAEGCSYADPDAYLCGESSDLPVAYQAMICEDGVVLPSAYYPGCE